VNGASTIQKAMMTEQNNSLNRLLSEHMLIETFRSYQSAWAQAPEYPFLTYVGINFDPTGVHSVKFYFHLFHRLFPETVNAFLPHSADFFRYYDFHEHSKVNTPDHSGCAFTLKYYSGRNIGPDVGFHYRLHNTQEAFEATRQGSLLPFNPFPVTHSIGISHEYRPDAVQRVKRYLYFSGSEEKCFFARHFGFEFLNRAVFIEFAETASDWKVNTWYGKDFEALKQADQLNSEQRKIVEQVSSDFGLAVKAYGFYNGSPIKSVYLFKPDNLVPETGIPHMTNQYVDTLGHMLRTAGVNTAEPPSPFAANHLKSGTPQ